MRAPAWWVARRRARLAERATDPVVAAWLRADAPSDATALADLPLLAVDLETTGLDPGADEILSIGLVPVDGDRIDLSGARHLLVRPYGEVGRSATIHGLTDDALEDGLPIADALHTLLDALTGRVLLAHHAAFEVGFLRAAVRRQAGVSVPIPSVCTLRAQERWLRTGGGAGLGSTEVRLPDARRAWGLARAPLHDALSDALACAELYLAQRSQMLTRRGVGAVGRGGHRLPHAALRHVRLT